MRRRRRGWSAAVSATAALLLMLVLGACGGSGGAGATPSGGTYTVNVGSGGGSAPAATGTETTSSSAAPDSRSPALRHLQAVVLRNGRTLGPDTGIAVEDLTTGQMLFSQNMSLAQPPASLEKLYTSAALLWKLGPDARLDTDLFGVGYKQKGIWHGNLYLRGGGDPTFGDGNWNTIYDGGYGPTAGELISDLRSQGIKGVDGYLYADPTRFDNDEGGPATDNAPDIPDYGGELSALVYDHGFTTGGLGPAQTAVHQVALYARSQHFHLLAKPQLIDTPPGATMLAQLQSPPMSVLLKLMLVPSDDLFADLFAKDLGFQFDDSGTLDGGAEVISSVISQRYGISPVIHDGSGLDKADRSTPSDFLTLLRDLNGTATGDVIRASLPVMGKTGTVQTVGLKTAAVGRCVAKTGTLNNVTNLAGYCDSKGGDLLAFVFMSDGPSNGQSLYTFGPMVGAVAAY